MECSQPQPTEIDKVRILVQQTHTLSYTDPMALPMHLHLFCNKLPPYNIEGDSIIPNTIKGKKTKTLTTKAKYELRGGGLTPPLTIQIHSAQKNNDLRR